jgi:2-polyprenyl-3-methyl-5-hydroxy-6-metoxy-1,4-benzoquinol methylase
MKTDDCFINQLPQFNRLKVELIYSCLEKKLLPYSKPVRILDVGCGTGELLTLPIAQLFQLDSKVSILGVDVHEESILRAMANVQRAGLSNISFSMDNKWQQDEFDIVLCSEVLEHVEDTKTFLSKLRKCVKEDGCLILTIPNGYGAFEIESFIYHKLGFKKFWEMTKKIFRRKGSVNAQTPLILETLNEDNNVHIHHFPYWKFVKIIKDLHFRENYILGVALFGGPLSNRLMEKFPCIFRLNIFLAKKLPAWMASGWIFVCED